MKASLAQKKPFARFFVAACAIFALCACLAACSPASSSTSASSNDSSSSSSNASSSSSTSSEQLLEAPDEITESDINFYCGACHFKEIENASIASFNSDTVDAAMIESMVPNASDELVQMLADYFAAIEPEEETH